MKLNLFALALLLSLTSCSYCSSCASSVFNQVEPQGEPDSTTLTLSGFNSITACCGLKITYTVTDKAPYAEITAPSDFLPYIQLTTKNSQLSCGLKSGCHFTNYSNKTHIQIYGPAVNDITTSSSARIELTNLLVTDKPVNLVASSSSSIILSLKAPAISAAAASSAGITLAATTATASFAAASSSYIQASVNAAKSVNAASSSSGTIQLEGSAPFADFIASSSGSLNAKNLKADTGTAVASSSGSISCSIVNPSSIHSSSSGTVRNNE